VADSKTNNDQQTSDILAPDQVEELREALLKRRQRILDLYDRDIRAGQESAQEGTDDLVDRANSAYNREFMFSLSNSEREQLLEIDRAIERLEGGTYGFCQYSGKPIAIERLKAVPWARYSVEYQELAEKGLLEERD
jgi:RNA polymerase-binding protein DksA